MNEKEKLRLKKFLSQIANMTMDDYFNLYKDEDRKYEENDDSPNFQQKTALELLKLLE